MKKILLFYSVFIAFSFTPVIASCQANSEMYPLTKVFVSSSMGDDANDGLTERTALKTIGKASMLADTLLLKAGDVFYEYTSLRKQYMTRYGEGKNPELCGLRIIKEKPWKKAGVNLWKINLVELSCDGYQANGSSDLNNIGCFYEVDKDALHGRKCPKIEMLSRDWDFYQGNIQTYKEKDIRCFDELYLYLSTNPNYLQLSLSTGSHYGIVLRESTIEKVDLRGFGTGGVLLYGYSNVKGCNIDLIGGSMMLYGNTTVCLGNGVNIWVQEDINDCIIEDNYISRCYDCGCTIQCSGHGQATPKNIIFRNNFITRCCQGWEDFLRNDDNVVYENCIFENNMIIDIGETSGFGYSDGRFKYSHILGNNFKGNKGMVIRNNVFVGGNYYCAGAFQNEYKSNVWEGNICIIKRGDFILSNYVGSKDVIRIPKDKGNFKTLQLATDDAIRRYRELTGDRTTHFVVKSDSAVNNKIRKLDKSIKKNRDRIQKIWEREYSRE